MNLLTLESVPALQAEVRALAAERGAVILAHNYQLPEVQDVADFVGDSLELAQKAIALFHTGQTGLGSGLPGGHRIKLRFSDPMLLDDFAADFPDLTVVMAHPAVPWVDSQIAIASHKANGSWHSSAITPLAMAPPSASRK